MKKHLLTLLFVMTFFTLTAVSASAIENETLKVGLRYGSNAMFSANLENHVGSGYQFGYFDKDREFVPVAQTDETTISMTPSGKIYMDGSGQYSAEKPSGKSESIGAWRVQAGTYETYEDAVAAQESTGGWIAWNDGSYCIYLGAYASKEDAQQAIEEMEPEEDDVVEEEIPEEDLAETEEPSGEEVTDPVETEEPSESAVDAEPETRETTPETEEAEPETASETFSMKRGFTAKAVKVSDYSVTVTLTRTLQILFEFNGGGSTNLGVMPISSDEEAVTWFKGYRYPGGFEYPRTEDDMLHVLNVVPVESYVRGVLPYEMSSSWPLAALEAQAVCARTFATQSTKHMRLYGFDVCNTTDCQVYYGYGNNSRGVSETTDKAVKNTRGECIYYDGEIISTAVYHSSNGGATEDVKNVWGGDYPYLMGKQDPYEAQISIPKYQYSVTYTAAELTYILSQKGYSVGNVKNVYVSEFTDNGNVKKLTVIGSNGTKVFTGSTCSSIFYSSTYGKSVPSLRFGINGSSGSGDTVCVNDSDTTMSALEGVCVISGDGSVATLSGSAFSVLSAEGTSTVHMGASAEPTSSNNGVFLIEGSGSGHNVGMSQYGAKAMAELGYSYLDILNFYYTDITVE